MVNRLNADVLDDLSFFPKCNIRRQMYSIQFTNLSYIPCLGYRRSYLWAMPAVIHLHQMTVATCTDHISHVWDFPG